MRILTWNIRHGGRSRAERLLKSLEAHNPDVVVLTEFRNNDCGLQIRQRLESFGLRQQSGSYAAPSINAVLVAARERLAAQVFDDLGENAHRCVLARIRGINIFGLYFPYGLEKDFLFQFLIDLAPRYLQGRSLLIGDLNTGKHHLDEAGATFFCSEHFERLEAQGWVDAWRHRYPVGREYTWYSHAGNGFRIDHAFVSPSLLPKVGRIEYSHQEREAALSDHSALIVEIV